jgi:rhodanese-related sulfurtransferase
MAISKITAQEVNERISRGEAVQFVDLRAPKAWREARTKLPGAIRVPPGEVEKHIASVPRDPLVVTYCTDPMKSRAPVRRNYWKIALQGSASAARRFRCVGQGRLPRRAER